MTPRALGIIIANVEKSDSLMIFMANSIHGKLPPKLKQHVSQKLVENVKKIHGKAMDYARFEKEEARWRTSSRDVRMLHSGYRNRDARLVMTGLMGLDKRWTDGELMKRVMKLDGEILE